MLEEYHRQTTLKPFRPILKDQSRRRWCTDSLNQFNLSLLSVSSSSRSSDDDADDIDLSAFGEDDRDSLDSRRSPSIVSVELDEQEVERLKFDPYILHKHLYGMTSTRTNLAEADVDSRIQGLFDGTKSSSRWRDEEYHPRAIRPPPFSEHLQQLKQANRPTRSVPVRSPRVSSVRTTRTESLRLERQQSARIEKQNGLAKVRPHTSLPQYRPTVPSHTRHSAIPLIKPRFTRSQTASDTSYQQSESTRSCSVALGLNKPLKLTSFLLRQMRQDIQSNRVPAYSKALNSALLREHPHPPLTRKYKLKRVRRWLEHVVPSDYLEFNEYASHATTAGTGSTEKLEDDSEVLIDEKRGDFTERTYEEAHRVLPLFRTEIDRKKRRHDLLLTRIELDLYVM